MSSLPLVVVIESSVARLGLSGRPECVSTSLILSVVQVG